MDTTTAAAIFADNQNFQTTKENKIYCRICATDASIQGWRKHTENPAHDMAAWRFLLEFEIQGARVRCRICSMELDWEAQKAHSASHKAAPENVYKIFFENHILEWAKTQYYCFCCCAIYPDWFAAFIHIEEKRHQKWIKAEQPENESLQLSSIDVSYKLLTCNAVWASNVDNVRCEICRCVDFGRQNIVQHIRGMLHKERKSAFGTMLATRRKELDDAEKSAECSKQSKPTPMHSEKADKARTNESDNKRSVETIEKSFVEGASGIKQLQHVCDPACKNVPCFYFVKRYDGDFYCKICDCVFIDYEFDFHVAGKRHLDSEQKLRDNGITIKNDKCFCGCCECTIIGSVNIAQHLRGDKHRRLKLKMELAMQAEALPVTTEIPAKVKSVQKSHKCVSGCQTLPCMYIEECDDGEIYCLVCDQYLPKNDLIKHVTGKLHAESVKSFNDNKITTAEGNNYHCGYCDCNIPGFDNIAVHINGNRHKKSQLKLEDESFAPETPAIVKIPVKAAPEVATSGKTLAAAAPEVQISNKNPFKAEITEKVKSSVDSARYIQKLNETSALCKSCNIQLHGLTTIEDHVMGELHTRSSQQFTDNKIVYCGDSKAYWCGYCDCTISGFVIISGHLKGTRHSQSKIDYKSANQTGIATTEISVKAKSVPKLHKCVSGCQTLPCMYIEECDDGEIYCLVCDQYLPKNDLIKHVTGKLHAESVKSFNDNKITAAEGNDYHCGYCDCNIPGFDNIAVHINGNRHKRSQLKLEDGSSAPETPAIGKIPVKAAPKEQTNNKIRIEVEPEVSINNKIPVKAELTNKATNPLNAACYILELSANNSICQICNVPLFDQKAIESHVAGNRHATAFQKYGCVNISFKEGNTFYCKCCNCNVPGLDNVFLHVKGYRHVTSLSLSAKETKTSKPASSWDAIISSLSNKLEGLTTTESKLTEPQKSNKLKSSQKVFGGQKLKLQEELICTVCNDKVKGSASMHIHMLRHVSGDFISPIDVKKTEQTSGKEQTEQSTVADSETTLHSNGRLVNTGLAMDGKKTFVKREEKTVNMKEVAKLLNFDKDHIYSMNDKLKDIELGLKLCYPFDSENIYCLICRKMVPNTMQNYFDHLYNLDHCEYLDKIERDHKLFENCPEEFSELALALESMEEISDDAVRCLVCAREFDNADLILREHIGGKKHRKKIEEMRTSAMRNFELVRSRIRCSWYQVQRYSCVPCLETFRSEVNFVKHLECAEHAFVMKQRVNSKRKMIFDFCGACALLWFGYRCTYSYHRDIDTHQWLERDGHYGSDELPESMKILLLAPEKFVEEKIKHYDEVATREREKEKLLIRDLEKALKQKIPLAKVYPFGSRVTGVGSPESDIDVFLDCGNMYDGSQSTMDRISKCMIAVHESLIAEPESWDVYELLTACRSPIIKVRHCATEISCDISFQNGLAVENTKLLKSFIDVYPACRKMILFLKQWLTTGDLSGSHAISNYALYWFVVFYLQNETILPSVNELIKMKNKSRKIAAWEVGVERNFTYNRAESYFSVKELITRFFKFYANFDFRYEIACPLIGETIKKRDFIDPANLPKEMATYIDYMKYSENPVPFRIDSTMCIQDPFDLPYNVTKAVSKVYVSRFRAYCSKSLDILCSTET